MGTAISCKIYSQVVSIIGIRKGKQKWEHTVGSLIKAV